MSILILPGDRVLVLGSGRPQMFELNGRYLGSFFISNESSSYMALTPDGLVAILSNNTGRQISLFDSGLNFVGSFGSPSYVGGGNLVSLVSAPQAAARVEDHTSVYNHGLGSIFGFAFDKSGDFYITADPTDRGIAFPGIYVMRRKFNEDNLLVRNRIPQPSIIRSAQRAGTTLIDIDYRVVDADSPTVQVAMLAFVDGGISLGSLVKMSTFAEGTQVNLGPGIPTNTDRRVTWNVATDWPVGFVNLQFEILAKDERGLLPFHFITVPVNGAGPAFTMSHQPVEEADLLSLWYWLIATSDSAISFVNGQVKGVGGAFDGQVLATGSSTTAAGRNFLFQRLNLRIPTSAEITRAQSGRYGFGSVSANSVVKLP